VLEEGLEIISHAEKYKAQVMKELRQKDDEMEALRRRKHALEETLHEIHVRSGADHVIQIPPTEITPDQLATDHAEAINAHQNLLLSGEDRKLTHIMEGLPVPVTHDATSEKKHPIPTWLSSWIPSRMRGIAIPAFFFLASSFGLLVHSDRIRTEPIIFLDIAKSVVWGKQPIHKRWS